MSDRLPRYLPPYPDDQCTRRRRRALRRAGRIALFPLHVLVALLRWLASPCFF